MQLSVHPNVLIVGLVPLQTHAAVQLDGLETFVPHVYLLYSYLSCIILVSYARIKVTMLQCGIATSPQAKGGDLT